MVESLKKELNSVPTDVLTTLHIVEQPGRFSMVGHKARRLSVHAKRVRGRIIEQDSQA